MTLKQSIDRGQFMLEIVIAAHLLGVDAFDQPAVEEGKVLAKKYLTAT